MNPTQEQIDKVVTLMKTEILECIESGQIPATVPDFSSLHDHIDANMLAEDAYPEDLRIEDWVDIFNPASDIVDAWLKARRPDGWPTAEDIVTSVKRSIHASVKGGEIKADLSDLDLDDELELADFHLIPDAPDAPTEREAFHARAEALMRDVEADLKDWLKKGEPYFEPEAEADTIGGRIYFEIDGEEYTANITGGPNEDMQAIQFDGPNGLTLWLHKPERA